MTARQLGGMPIEVRLTASIIGGGAVAFMVEALVRSSTDGGGGLLQVPIVFLLIALVSVGLLVMRPRAARVMVAFGALLPALLHMTIAVGNGPWWVRVISAVIGLGNVYAVVLVNTRPSREFLDGAA